MPAITLDSRTARCPREHGEQRLRGPLGGALPASHAGLGGRTTACALGRVAEEGDCVPNCEGCGRYACGFDGRCYTDCYGDSQCAPGFDCNTAAERCE